MTTGGSIIMGDDLREYYFSGPNGAPEFLDTVEIRHPAFTTPVRLVNDFQDLIATLETDAPVNGGATVTFTGVPFEVTLPESAQAGLPTFTLAVSNVARETMPYMQQALAIAAPIELSFRQFLVADTSAPELVMHGLTVKSATAGILRVQLQAGFEDLLNRPWPFTVYTTARYPTLAR